MILKGKKVVIMGVRNKWSIALGAVQSASEQGAEVICTCSADSTDKVKELLKEIPKENLIETNQRKVYKLEEDKNEFQIVKEEDMYVVIGPAVEKLMSRVNLEDTESMYYFQRKLDELGVNEALKKAGVKDGDTVKVVDWELEWYD